MENIDKSLVDELDKLNKQQKEIEDKISNIKAEIIHIAKLENKEFIFGTHKMCSVKPFDKVIYPEDKTALINLIKSQGLYDNLFMLNYSRISSKIKKTMCHHTLKVFCCGKKSPAGECGLIGTCSNNSHLSIIKTIDKCGLFVWMQEKTFMVFSAQKILLKEFSCAPKLKAVTLRPHSKE